jgi:predicted nucleotidyltransferase
MIFHNILDILFSTWSHTAVLRVLWHYSNGITGREISRLAGMNHRACQKALATLESIGIIERRRGGRDHLFTLNRTNILVIDGVLPLLAVEEEFSKKAFAFLAQKLKKYCISIILFGSVARKDETVTSDFDLCLIVEKDQQTTTTSDVVHSIAGEFRRTFGGNIAPFIITHKEFVRRANRKQSPIPAITKEGIIIHGLSLEKLING